MANYRHPSIKASETVTFRLTVEEKHRLNQLAKLEHKSKTDLIRQLLADEADRKGLASLKVPTVTKSPAVPKSPKVSTIPTGPTRPTGPTSPTTPTLEESLRSGGELSTFGDLVERFRDSFRDRAEGTRKELDDTLRFLAGVESDYPALLPLDLSIEELTSLKLQEVRRTILLMNIRVAKKNLHLTYLRMMLHYAVKQSKGLSINPAMELASFTISELPKAWPGRSG